MKEIKKNLYDIVLFDCNLPDGTGFELCREVRGFSNIPMLMLTARNTEMDEIKALELGVNDYLSKLGKVNPDYKFTLPSSWSCYPYAIDERLVLNKSAQAFYSKLSADESKLKNIVKQSVMTSRNCLIRNHCLCSKDGGKTSGYTLVIGKHRFKIVCDCVACKMHLIAL